MSLWSDSHAATIDQQRFRAHHQYLDQHDSYDYEGMAAWLGLPYAWDKHDEDGAFGCVTRVVNGRTVSRDLLDSLVELTKLREWLGDEALRRAVVLDIGAGYGRFAHRFLTEYPEAGVVATDPEPVSRHVLRTYRAHRAIPSHGLQCWPPRALAMALPFVGLAVNIHCWSECTRDEIRWWADRLGFWRVPRLFIVPHDRQFVAWRDGTSYVPDLEAVGYRMAESWTGPACQPELYSLWVRS